MTSHVSPVQPDASQRPPVDSEVPVVGYSVDYGFGAIVNAGSDPLQVKVFIFDQRKNPDGSNFANELFVLKDSLYATLPDAYQFPGGVIRFFAYESQLPAVLAVLSGRQKIWLRTRNGRVSLVTNEA